MTEEDAKKFLMTQRTTMPLAFSSVRRRQLVAGFTVGHITSDAGLLLLREADKQIGLPEGSGVGRDHWTGSETGEAVEVEKGLRWAHPKRMAETPPEEQ